MNRSEPPASGIHGRPTSSDDRYEEILTAAERLIHDRGYHAVSVRDLARAVGVKMSSLYYYFESKEHILYSISRRTMEQLICETELVLLERQSESIDCRLSAAIRTGVVFHIEHQAAAGVVLSEVRRLAGAFRDDLRLLMKTYENLFRDLVREGVASGTFVTVDPSVSTFIIMSALTRISIWYQADGRLGTAAVAEIYSDSLVRMLRIGPPPSCDSFALAQALRT